MTIMAILVGGYELAAALGISVWWLLHSRERPPPWSNAAGLTHVLAEVLTIAVLLIGAVSELYSLSEAPLASSLALGMLLYASTNMIGEMIDKSRTTALGMVVVSAVTGSLLILQFL